MFIQRRFIGAATVVAALVAVTYSGLDTLGSQQGARASDSMAASGWLRELGLDESGITQPTVLSEESDELILSYPRSADFDEIGAQWSAGLENAGYEKVDDHSSIEERKVLQFEKGSSGYLVLLGDTGTGPLVVVSNPAKISDHWAMTARLDDRPQVVAGVW